MRYIMTIIIIIVSSVIYGEKISLRGKNDGSKTRKNRSMQRKKIKDGRAVTKKGKSLRGKTKENHKLH